ncbi:sirohydrochlorin chelatase [Parasedimentitalea maritima]|uniref:Cobalamin biosynthesis protein CbiX n=1 Tax=Parasedimentitalea maritima TaxID=2578117 RepID=A0A6A4REY7_9RHOB|nr:CbiX/SirB N-terminal domain-containing protein [Zongyanglinia marina]KAE9627228.1 cobalamin biosynthesis protein CbiX [Zongyanglinia marina]
MSGIKSPFPKAPATENSSSLAPREALIVAHGQPGDSNPPELALARLAVQVQERLSGWRIQSATMACPGALETAVKGIAQQALVYPFFMTEGWFVREALPRRLAPFPLQYLQPFGTDPELPTLAALTILREITWRFWTPELTHIVVAAHGSKRSANAALAAQNLAEELSERLPCASVQVGFLDQAPHISQTAADLSQQALCLPFFARDGGHISRDITAALQDAQFQGVILPVLGHQPLVPDLIARALETAHTSGACA